MQYSVHDLVLRSTIWSFIFLIATSVYAQSSQQQIDGYLSKDSLVDSAVVLPPPPEWGTAALALDEATNRADLRLRGTPRWDLAIQDADLSFPHAANTFSCALKSPITEKDTPTLFRLLEKTLVDAGNATDRAKEYYHRKRPFVVNSEPICTPDWQDTLKRNGAYPSGHASIGWTWALILMEIAPDRAESVLIRGREFGESRLVCNVHWFSDVVESRVIASATFARLIAEPQFQADLKQAAAELAEVRRQALPPLRDCAAESITLSTPPPVAP
jgi:acid phosphatase (class A)